MHPSCPRPFAVALLALLASPAAGAQNPGRPLPTVEQQIGASVMALPADMRDGATVLGYRTKDSLEVLRTGTNGMTCLAIFALETDFHVACYQSSLEPFMARGRALRAKGVKGEQADSVRSREARSGKLPMPKRAIMYQLFGGEDAFDSLTGSVKNVSTLLIIYFPFARGRDMGLSEKPSDDGPWLMYAGSYKAHMMVMGKMNPKP